LPDTDTNGAVHVATKIKAALANIGLRHAQTIDAQFVTMSFGVASMIPTGALSPEKLVSFADKARYKAKETGRNRISIFEQGGFVSVITRQKK